MRSSGFQGRPRIRIEEVRFFRDRAAAEHFGAHPETEGFIWYELEYDVPGAEAVFPDDSQGKDVAYSYMMQPFWRKPSELLPKHGNIWQWDGNREAPTISPSYLCRDKEVCVHLFVRLGRIDLCSDSTVVLGGFRYPPTEESGRLKRGEVPSDTMTPTPGKKGRHSTPDDIEGKDANPESSGSRVSSPSPEATEASSPTDKDTRHETPPSPPTTEAVERTIPLRDDPRDVAPAVPEGWTTSPHGDGVVHICPHKVAHTPGAKHSPCDGCCDQLVIDLARGETTLGDLIAKPTETATDS